MKIDWSTVAIVIVVVLAAAGLVFLACFAGARQADGAYDTEPEAGDEGDDFNRPTNPAALASGEQVDRWRTELLTEYDVPAEPAHHAALSLYGRMRNAVVRVMRAPTQESAVVQPDVEQVGEDEGPQLPEPFDPLTSPMEVEPTEPVDTWALTPTPPTAWADRSFTEQWLALTPERIAELQAQRERAEAGSLLTPEEVSA
jgi:hypothetical protein